MREETRYFAKRGMLNLFALPLSWLYGAVMGLRKICYRIGLCPSVSLAVPVVVIGNICVGGAGKTPVIIALVEALKAKGLHVGVVSRGYGGSANKSPTAVTEDSLASEVGDEPLLIARRTNVPVVIGCSRVAACELLLKNHEIDVVLSDDGLSHYALARDIEIIVIDETREHGNGYLLPAGPLREPVSRIKHADFTLHTNSQQIGEAKVRYQLGQPYQVAAPTHTKSLSAFAEQPVHAVAGLAHPEKFFTSLYQQGVTPICHAFSDHYAFTAQDFSDFKDALVLMTEKDSVKCTAFATESMYAVPLDAQLPQGFVERLLTKLKEKRDGR